MMKVCWAYNNFWRSDEGVRLQCEFDIAAGVSAEDTKELFLADRTNGRAIGTLLRLSICLSSVTLCIVAKRCVLEQKLLLRAYRKSYMRNRLVPK